MSRAEFSKEVALMDLVTVSLMFGWGCTCLYFCLQPLLVPWHILKTEQNGKR